MSLKMHTFIEINTTLTIHPPKLKLALKLKIVSRSGMSGAILSHGVQKEDFTLTCHVNRIL
jgi:hypothetical protein